jgi:hypothetical protein
MTSHFGLMLLFAMFVATIFAAIARDTAREQILLGLRLWAAFIATGLALGWVMRVFPL